MGNSLLFKWEDSQALKHHCGVCERPMSHPGARNSCFGVHSEPCIRFHQAMFMRTRAHTCAYCISINEAHHKRHNDIVQQLRIVYDSCGQVDWSILPYDQEERGRARNVECFTMDNDEADGSPTAQDTAASKRDRKHAKSLARAASRARVVTQEEILYVDSVIHAVDGMSNSDSDGPRNPEEIEEIERHLRYNAHVYNTQPNRRGLKHFARMPDADVDFNVEMERILEIFRVSELLKRNTKNRGLQGRELKVFQTLVEILKQALIEDIVLVRKDFLEIRMRRAGFLRYTNKTAYGIVEDRYTDKDWKTGEKLTSASSDSSGMVNSLEDASIHENYQEEGWSARPPQSSHSPDRRHLKSVHKRVNGDDGLYEYVIEPYRAPLLPLLPTPTPEKKLTSIKIIANQATNNGAGKVRGGGKMKYTVGQGPDGWQTVLRSQPTVPVVKPSWIGGSTTQLSEGPVGPWIEKMSEFPRLSTLTMDHQREEPSKTLAVQAPAAAAVAASKAPEQFVVEDDKHMEEQSNDHPIVSQKKTASKKAREARRKAKKLTAQDQLANAAADQEPSPAEDCPDERSSNTTIYTSDRLSGEDVPPLQPTEVDGQSQTDKMDLSVPRIAEHSVELSSTLPLQSTKHAKHIHWLKFARYFVVDQLTNPILPSWRGCSHVTACAFEGNDVPDCPFHEPHCPCVDPLQDSCFLVYPCSNLYSSGPYNRLHGEKLMAMFEEDSRTKGRVMLVDDELVPYLMEDPQARTGSRNACVMPKCLADEYDDFYDGYDRGPLMEQERLFDRLLHKNKVIKQKITRRMLQNIQREFERGPVMCFCQDTIPEEGFQNMDVIVCSHRDCTIGVFHKFCVKKLGFDKVTRWYCTSCEQKMGALARKTLRDLGYTDIPDECGPEEQKLREMLKMTPSMMKQLKDRVEHIGGKVKGVSVMAFDMD